MNVYFFIETRFIDYKCLHMTFRQARALEEVARQVDASRIATDEAAMALALMRSFYKCEFPHKFVNFFIYVIRIS